MYVDAPTGFVEYVDGAGGGMLVLFLGGDDDYCHCECLDEEE